MNKPILFNPYIIALITLLPMTIVYFFIQRRKKIKLKTEKESYRKFKKEEVDMNNLMNSINKSSQLHRELSRKYHPDRFLDQEKKTFAEELMKEINGNKTDYNKLLDLKEKANHKLTNKT
ncbi:hypothetical protein [Saccharicrinis sp. 156]|uniref:hypothetical protein n=1 Tax=Saccharicrinis sp. 156 TaxID=3417574 RepID=UPI003D350D9E